MYIKFPELAHVSEINVKFSNDAPMDHYNLLDSNIKQTVVNEGIYFTRSKCEDLADISIITGKNTKVYPTYDPRQNIYFKKTTPNTYTVKLENLEQWVNTIPENSPETSYSVMITGIDGSLQNVKKVASILAEAPDNVYVDISPTDLMHTTYEVSDALYAAGSRPFPRSDFRGIINITGITIPATDNHILERTFEGCTNLKYIYFETDSYDGWKITGSIPSIDAIYTEEDLKEYYNTGDEDLIPESIVFKNATSFNSKAFADNGCPPINSPKAMAAYAAGIYSVFGPGFRNY